MYEGWRIEEWRTPVSEIKALQMVSLSDADSALTIVVEGLLDPERRRYSIRFHRYPAYRNINESYRVELWSLLGESVGKWGRTFVVPDSPWIESFSGETLRLVYPALTHYVLCTEDDVIEILSPDPPEIMEVEPAREEEEPPGKSAIYWK